MPIGTGGNGSGAGGVDGSANRGIVDDDDLDGVGGREFELVPFSTLCKSGYG